MKSGIKIRILEIGAIAIMLLVLSTAGVSANTIHIIVDYTWGEVEVFVVDEDTEQCIDPYFINLEEDEMKISFIFPED